MNKKIIQVLAIDPGTRETAFVWIDKENNCIGAKDICSNDNFLGWIYSEQPDYVFCEMIASYGMPVGKDVFETCLFIGRIQEACKTMGIPFTLVYRKDVKMHLCNSTRSKDSNIRRALLDKYGETGTKKEPNEFYNDGESKMRKDIWAALAVYDYGNDTYLKFT